VPDGSGYRHVLELSSLASAPEQQPASAHVAPAHELAREDEPLGEDIQQGVDVLPGISLHLELERFVAAGFTPLEALQTATLNPAMFYDKLGDYGRVQSGRIADLVMLSANPLTDIRNTRTITGVVADGRYLSPTDLDRLRAKLEQVAANR